MPFSLNKMQLSAHKNERIKAMINAKTFFAGRYSTTIEEYCLTMESLYIATLWQATVNVLSLNEP